jgi:hypothetical protein
MNDPRLPTMLCMTCDHEVRPRQAPDRDYDRRVVGETEAPADRQPDMRRLRAASQDAKTGRVKASWAKFSPGSSFDTPACA